VVPTMASTAPAGTFPAVFHSSSFLPLATMSREASLASAAASLRPSLRLAETVSRGSIPLASRNLDALPLEVQPLRW
jgi:hypothetical protein